MGGGDVFSLLNGGLAARGINCWYICCGACSYCIISGGGNWAENVANTAAEGFFLGLLPGDPLLKIKSKLMFYRQHTIYKCTYLKSLLRNEFFLSKLGLGVAG